MARARAWLELRLVTAALARRRGAVTLAVVAIAIGASVACALLHVSRDVSRKLTRELRALGPNLLVLPPSAGGSGAAAAELLDQALVSGRLREAGLEGAPLLFATVRIGERGAPLVGADLASARRLHPSWRVGPGDGATLLGARLARALGVQPGDTLRAAFAPTGRTLALPVGALLESGGPDDEAWWIPLGLAQGLTGLEGRISLVQARLEDPSRSERVTAILERGGAARAVTLRALSSAEAGLLERMRRLMAYVTLGVLLSAGLCAYGTLTDLALERRREIALLKALGAGRADVARVFGAESLAVGLLGGLAGWWMGVVAAQVIGREVFHSAIALQWGILPPVIALSMLVALLAGLGPLRLALRIEPAAALKGD